MNLQTHIPGGPLQEFVHSIHFISGKESGTGVAFPRMHQVIILNLGTRFSSSDVYTPAASAVVRETSSAVWINGKQDDPFLLGNAGVTAMYTITLKLGMVPYFAELPAIETNNLALGAENWTSREIFGLRERLLECGSVASGFLLIKSYLLRLLSGRDLSGLERVKWLGKAMYTQTVDEFCRQFPFIARMPNFIALPRETFLQFIS